MNIWQTYDFEETLIKTKIGKKNQINASEIKPAGRYPVIDQGQSFIAGYSDEELKVIRKELPVIIFGDHTRCFKFVDFPFIIGADGTKILKPKEELFDPKFYYFALFSLKIPNRGYNRHFKLLKEQSVPHPPLPEQKKIAHILSIVQQVIEQQEQIIVLTTELKKALMHRLFTEGLYGEPQKETEIGLVPESWEVVKLGELAKKPEGRIQTGPFGSQLHKDEYQNSGIPVVNPTHLIGNRINRDDVPRIAPKKAEELSRHKLLVGDILFARRGEIGRHGLVTENEQEWLCGTGSFLVRIRKDFVDNRFISYYFSTQRAISWLESHAAGAIMPNLNSTVLSLAPIPIPCIEEQREIAELFDSIEKKLLIIEKRKTQYQDLFRTLLYQLMTAQIRVHELEFEESV